MSRLAVKRALIQGLVALGASLARDGNGSEHRLVLLDDPFEYRLIFLGLVRFGRHFELFEQGFGQLDEVLVLAVDLADKVFVGLVHYKALLGHEALVFLGLGNIHVAEAISHQTLMVNV